jgi:hypothetical protein
MARRARAALFAGSAAALLYARRADIARLVAEGRRRLAARRTPTPTQMRREEPGVPSDVTTVTELVDGGQARGYTEQFVLTPTGIRCQACGERRDPAEYGFESLRRLEGASDPDDAQAVLAVHCPVCDAAGSLVVNYGPAASPEESDALAAMQDRRSTSAIPAGEAPGEHAAGAG